MDKFENAVEFVLSNEGGFSDNPSDAGGATNFGISLRFLKSLSQESLRRYGFFKLAEELCVDDIRNLTRDQAKLIYRGEFWERAPFDKMEHSQEIRYCLDMAVHHGLSQAVKLIQRATWAIDAARAFSHSRLKDDGIFGEKTLEAVNSVDSLICILMSERAGFMRLLCEINPKNKEFLDGWLARCYRV